MLSIMIYDDSRDAVVQRLAGVLGQVRRALETGLTISRAIHAEQGWRPEADRNLWPYLVRREVLEHLRDLHPVLDDTDNFGLPMSGIRIEPTVRDVIRIWRSDTGTLPPPRTESIRAYYRQRRTHQDPIPGLDPMLGLDPADGQPAAPNHLAVLWWDDGSALSRLDLVRPCGVEANRAVVEWTVDMLSALDRIPDLGYDTRAGGEEEGEETG
jgi:hypothetical protein